MLVVGGRIWLCRGAEDDGAQGGEEGASDQAGAAAPCEPWQAVAIVEVQACAGLGLRGVGRRRVSRILKGAGTARMGLVGRSRGSAGRYLGSGGRVRALDWARESVSVGFGNMLDVAAFASGRVALCLGRSMKRNPGCGLWMHPHQRGGGGRGGRD